MSNGTASLGGCEPYPAAAGGPARHRDRSEGDSGTADARASTPGPLALLRQASLGRQHRRLRELPSAGACVLRADAGLVGYWRTEGRPQGALLHQSGGDAVPALLLGRSRTI